MSLTFLQNTAMAAVLTMTTAFSASAGDMPVTDDDWIKNIEELRKKGRALKEKTKALKEEKAASIASDTRIQDLLDTGDLTELNQLTYMESPWIIDIERISSENVDEWIDQLQSLTRIDPTQPIVLRLGESPGGSQRDGMNLIDALHAAPNPIVALCTEYAYSMGAVILYTLQNGIRISTENCDIMSHEARFHNISITTSSLENLIEYAQEAETTIIQYTSQASGLSIEDSAKLHTHQDLHLTPRQAMGAGLIDVIIPHRTRDNPLRNRVTATSGTSAASWAVTNHSNAEDFKHLFCEATRSRKLDYCQDDKIDEPVFQEAQKTAQTNNLDFN